MTAALGEGFKMKASSYWMLLVAASVLVGCSVSESTTPQMPGSQSAVIADRPGSAKVPGHLYVAGAAGSNVERFSISDGKPTLPPDLTYSGVGAPIVITSTGHALYATSASTITEFRNGSTKPVLTLNVSPPCNSNCYGGAISSLLVDPEGHLFVGYEYSEKFCHKYYGCLTTIYFVTYVYAAGASGNAQPSVSISAGSCNQTKISQCAGAVSGLSLDAEGELLTSFWESTWFRKVWTTSSAVYAYSSPTSYPKLVRTLTGSGVGFASGLAVDRSDEMYVDNPTDPPVNTSNSFIAAYPASANGSPPPDREISVPGAQFGFGIAVSPLHLLYVPDPVNNVVYELRSSRDGQQKPISVLQVSRPEDVKLGP
jgi:hypothetical protein